MQVLFNKPPVYLTLFVLLFGTAVHATENLIKESEQTDQKDISEEDQVVEESFNLKLFPNPATSYFTIASSGKIDLKEVEIFNLLGERVF